ncbi:COG4223 family protein [Brucella gallinifaecis]|uniref:Mitochondrial inner membrane family protein n=1 Tax=Brucella gallinifaecis TaxID=215590 RepID=A0A502BL14_9HYPH|nr:mitofilin family membrane protein [Brucella gallinifaecis]TPF74805.1 hypothetical protein FHY56_12360 [Brucella gallinifaecis]
MAKSGTPRHSKPAQKPVTINLDPSNVKRVDEAEAPKAEPVGDFQKKIEQKSEAKVEKPPFTAGVKPEAPRAGASTSASTAAAPVQKSGSAGSYLLAGVAGGVIALAGLFALQWGNVVPSAGSRVSAEQLAHLQQQIAELRSNPAPAPLDESSKAQLANLQKNVEAAEIKAEAVASGFSEIQQQFASLPKADSAPIDVSALTERLTSLEQQLKNAADQADQAASHVTDNSTTITDLQQKLAVLDDKLRETSRQPDASKLIAANALKTAIDRGGSFKAELDTYTSVAPQDKSVEKLETFAHTGVPTIADLNAWFGPVANKMIATENKLPADAGVWDQLMASAKGLVSVRPVAGNVSGTGIGPITARMEAALHAGDLERALSEWEQLPPDAKAVSEEFIGQMIARRDADALIQRVIAESIKPKAATNATAPN